MRDFIRRGNTVKENKLADLSMLFAVKALELTNLIEGHYSLKNQFERSATSIGTNIREANIVKEQNVKNLLRDCGELRRILVSSITTLKSKQ